MVLIKVIRGSLNLMKEVKSHRIVQEIRQTNYISRKLIPNIQMIKLVNNLKEKR